MISSILILHVGSGSRNSPAVDLGPYFPYLTPEERENSYYLQELKEKTESIQNEFESLVIKLQRDIENSESYGYKDVVNLLSLKKNTNFEEVLKDCQNLAEVLIRIKKYFSFFDYGLIKHLAHNFGSSDFKKKLKKYKKRFQNYAKHRVCEYPRNAFGNVKDSEKVYKIKIEEDIRILTGENLERYKYQVNKILGYTFMCLVDVKDGCVEFTLRGFEDDQLDTAKEQKQASRKLGVVNISYGNSATCINLYDINSEEKLSGNFIFTYKPQILWSL